MPVASAVRGWSDALHDILPSNMSSGPTQTVFSRTNFFIFRLTLDSKLELSVTRLNWYAAYARLTSELRARANQLRLRAVWRGSREGSQYARGSRVDPLGPPSAQKPSVFGLEKKSRKLIFFVRCNFIICRSEWARKTYRKVKYHEVRRSSPSQPTLLSTGAKKRRTLIKTHR